jgi:thiol-disulfide isomerase/thioredoxin
MGIWDILLLILFLVAFGITAYAGYRWWKVKKMLSYTKKLIGKRIEDLINVPNLKGVLPINIPKKGEVVLLFKGPNCKLCPKQEEEIKKLPKNLRVFQFDVRTKQGKAIASLFRVAVLPTVVVLKDRTIKGYFTAFATQKQIIENLKKN